jgi:hypothetical protein
MCALFKAYQGERVLKAIADRLHAPSYLSRIDHNWKIRARKQRTDVGKYSFVNRTITDWNQLSEEETGAPIGNTYSFRKRVRRSEGDKSEMRGSEALVTKLKYCKEGQIG